MEEKKEELKREEKSLAMELLEELKRQNKRLITALFIVISLWTATIGAFLLYLNQYDFSNSVEQTGVYTFSDSQGNVISSDITAEQMKEILEVINNGENQSNEKEN